MFYVDIDVHVDVVGIILLLFSIFYLFPFFLISFCLFVVLISHSFSALYRFNWAFYVISYSPFLIILYLFLNCINCKYKFHFQI
jgi:hypothetical protein